MHLSPTTCYRLGCSPCHRSLHDPRVTTTTQQPVGISHPPQTWPSHATFFLTSTKYRPARPPDASSCIVYIFAVIFVFLFQPQVKRNHIFELVYRLGSKGVQKIHASRLLRSHQTGNQYLYFLQRLTKQWLSTTEPPQFPTYSSTHPFNRGDPQPTPGLFGLQLQALDCTMAARGGSAARATQCSTPAHQTPFLQACHQSWKNVDEALQAT